MSQSRRSARKKRQTQLTFTPLPSSSPAAKDYPDQVQQRAAVVRYDENMSSPTKKRRLFAVSSPDVPGSSPQASKGRTREGQAQVQMVESPSRKPSQLPTPVASSQVEPADVEDLRSKTSPSRKLFRQNFGVNAVEPERAGNTTTRLRDSSTDPSSEDEAPVPSTRRNRAAPINVVPSSDEDSVFVAPSPPSRPSFSTPRAARSFLLGGNSGNAPISNSQRRNLVSPKEKRSSLKTNTEASDKSRGTNVKNTTRKLRRQLSVSPSPNEQTDDSVRKSRSPQTSKNGKRAPVAPDILVLSDYGENSSSEDVIATPLRRRRHIGQLRFSSQEPKEPAESSSDNLQEEVDDLRDTEIRTTRTRGRQDTSERSIRQRKLEELKRRRAGVKEESEESGLYSSDSDKNLESDPEPILLAPHTGGNLDEYEDDFVDDNDATLGVDLGLAGVPIELSYHANKKPFEHFKTEVEWMVHNKINPAFERHDEIYELAHRKLADVVYGWAGLRFKSAVWKEDFTKALEGRPNIFRTDIPTMLEHKCDACQRSGHPPKHKITFAGKSYDRDTLETIDEAADDDSSDNSEQQNAEGNSSSSNSSTKDEQIFFLGSFCRANAEMYHALYHWRYALNQTVLDWLKINGHLTPTMIVERESLRRKKREKSANKIVDGMVENGIMQELYKQFKENLEIARSTKPERFAKDRE